MSVNLPEIFYHNYWKNLILPLEIRSLSGEVTTIRKHGLYNLGKGPDFLDAEIEIGGKIIIGDVEIHEDEVMWQTHGHNNDPAYKGVILHVFFGKPMKEPLEVKDEKSPLRIYIPLESLPEAIAKPNRYDLMGLCGVALNEKNFPVYRSIINQAAEARLEMKLGLMRDKYSDAVRELNDQALYTEIFGAFGLPDHSLFFMELAQLYPFSTFIEDFHNRSVHRSPEDFSSKIKKLLEDHFEEEVVRIVLQKKSYPQGHFENRVFQLFFPLYAGLKTGLIKYFLKSIMELPATSSGLKKPLLAIFKPSGKIWDNLPSAGRIGEQRVTTILINTLIPFFLLWSEKFSDEKLKNKLFEIYLLAPIEKNGVIDYMKKRMGMDSGGFKIKSNLRMGQGMIQLKRECCRHFERNCTNCTLITRLIGHNLPDRHF